MGFASWLPHVTNGKSRTMPIREIRCKILIYMDLIEIAEVLSSLRDWQLGDILSKNLVSPEI
jgi:hypothetical protein